jgi:hypothetical protein
VNNVYIDGNCLSIQYMEKSTSWFMGSIVFTICVFLQLYVLFRYVTRNPGDLIGMILFSLTTVCFAIAAVGFFITSQKIKEGEHKDE